MTYGLAKELKEAGFPQGGQQEVWCCDCKHKFLPKWDDASCPHEGAIYIPTLEELIEACGEKFFELQCFTPFGNNKYWQTHSTDDLFFKADTPTEAVARLWLALNKK